MVNFKQKLLGVFILCVLHLGSFSQQALRGKVKAESGDPIANASVTISGTSLSTATDNTGNYVLDSPHPSGTLTFSSVGYQSAMLGFTGAGTYDITLIESLDVLDEVVVVGYATAKRATLTGSVADVKGEELLKSPVTNVSQTLAGRLPGVTAMQRSGEPGNDGALIRIRGANTLGDNSALIIVDGIPNRSLERIDPNSIESITVLKDASAAIYGSQAANGVILITTKTGAIGKSQFSLNFNQGFNAPTMLPKMTNAADYATALNEIDHFAGRDGRFSPTDIENYRTSSDPWKYPNTDWYGAVFRDWSGQNKLNANLSGGTEAFRYFLSANTQFQDAYYKESAMNYRQHDFQANMDGNIAKNLTLSVNITGRLERPMLPTVSTAQIYRSTFTASPMKPAFWPNGEVGPDIIDATNPVSVTRGQAGYNDQKLYTFNSNVNLTYTFPGIEGLSVSGIASYDQAFQLNKIFQTPWKVNAWDGVTYGTDGVPVLSSAMVGYTEPRLTQQSAARRNSLLSAIGNYEAQFGDHHIKLLAGMEAIERTGTSFEAFRRYYVSTTIPELFAGGDQDKDNTGSSYEQARLNYFGRFNYNFSERYLFEFVWRYDGSYIFPKENRFGFFPGVSVGWRVSEEAFWNKSSLINDLKIRASWGQTGNDRINEWQYLSSYAYSSATYLFGLNDQNKLLYETNTPNPYVSWEVANQYNVGLDLLAWHSRFNLTAEYFYNKRSNILWYRNATVPGSAGIALPRENIGVVQNQGVDLTLGYQDQAGEFQYGLSIIGGYAKNKVLFWDEPEGAPEWQRATGKPIPSAISMTADLYYDVIGVFRDADHVESYPHWSGARPGDLIFRDVDENGVIDANDKIRVDRTELPRFTGGLSMNAAYKGFDFSLLFQGSLGGLRYDIAESGEIGNYYQSFFDERWTPDNPDSEGPRVYNRWASYWTDLNNPNTFFLSKTDFVRLKNIELGYRLPATLISRFGLANMRVYFSGYNLFTFGPEIDNFDPESPYLGVYTKTYPIQKIINFGINLTL